ncbi:unnamed protein product [Lactuca saligna]|uniref:Ubiquitin-like protease family profile domain-containing protein n=1 Tax=Lactuca saligna TaxID=75948 RepID=A0AA35ZWF2_LACSI|nr:unnamed protein product [Lactuca saligna]
MKTRIRIEKSSILKMNAMIADGQVTKVDYIKVQSENDLFGYDSYTYLTWDDFEALLTMDELTGAIIVSYMIRHWVLVVLDMKSDTCYYLDSLSSGNFNMQLKQIVDSEMVLYTTQSGSNNRVKLNLCPVQPGSTECGYYMLRFMKEIVEKQIEVLVNDNIRDGKVEYTTDDIDKIREECSEFVMGFIYR